MKRLPVIFAAALTAFSAVFSTAASAKESSLVVLGDSITSGYGLEGYVAGDNYSAPDSFANQLSAAYSDYSNFAKDGRTSGELLTALEDEDISAALAGADTVVISIGGNDYLQPMISAIISIVMEDSDLKDQLTSGEFSPSADFSLELMQQLTETIINAAKDVDADDVCSNISSILSAVKNAAPDAQVIILTVYDPFEGVTGMEMMDVVAREKLAELNAGIKDAAAANGAEVADVFTAFKGSAEDYTNITRMDIHPSKEGHAVIYAMLSEMAEVPSEPVSADVQPGTAHKGSPDTGAGDIAVFAGIALTAAAAAYLTRKKR